MISATRFAPQIDLWRRDRCPFPIILSHLFLMSQLVHPTATPPLVMADEHGVHTHTLSLSVPLSRTPSHPHAHPHPHPLPYTHPFTPRHACRRRPPPLSPHPTHLSHSALLGQPPRSSIFSWLFFLLFSALPATEKSCLDSPPLRFLQVSSPIRFGPHYLKVGSELGTWAIVPSGSLMKLDTIRLHIVIACFTLLSVQACLAYYVNSR